MIYLYTIMCHYIWPMAQDRAASRLIKHDIHPKSSYQRIRMALSAHRSLRRNSKSATPGGFRRDGFQLQGPFTTRWTFWGAAVFAMQK